MLLKILMFLLIILTILFIIAASLSLWTEYLV